MGNKRYEKYMKSLDNSHQERLDKIRNDKRYYAFTKEREEAMKPFYEKYGRSWHIFVNMLHLVNGKPNWIDQYRVIDPEYKKGTNKEEE